MVRRWSTSLILMAAWVTPITYCSASSPVDTVAPGVSEVRKITPTVVAPVVATPERKLLALAFERGDDTGLRVKITLDGPTRAEASTQDAPDRLVIDFQDTSAGAALFPAPPSGTLLTDYRLGRVDGGRLRLILDLAAPGRIVTFVPDASRAVLTLDVARQDGPGTPQTSVIEATPPRAVSPAPPWPQDPPVRHASGAFVVVIDPGHGGIDPGAVAPSGLTEKDLVFAVAVALQRELATRPDVQVHMTRDSDVFVRLDDRVRFAAEVKADLFVSIHADQFAGTAGATAVRGGSVYVLGDAAPSRATAALVARENAVDALLGRPLDDQATARDVSSILSDFTARETQDLSLRAQSLFVRDLRGAMTLAREPVRAAAFRVLRQADVPSVLIELGYMSHVADMAELVSPTWQRRVAVAMARAIDTYRERLRQDRDFGRSPVP